MAGLKAAALACLGISMAGSAMAQIPTTSLVPGLYSTGIGTGTLLGNSTPTGGISATARSVNGSPPVDTEKKTGPGSFVSATASSTKGGTASSSAAVTTGTAAGFVIP